jgi:zinc/manganese transport system ATP-binding protein
VRPQDIAYLPQVAEIDRSFPISVYDMVAMGCGAARAVRRHRRKDRETIEQRIAAVGLTGFEPRPIGTLSGGRCSACCSRGCCCRTRA